MSDILVALFFGAGVAGWTYAQLARRSGNANPGSTYVASGVVGLIAAIVIFTVFKFTLNV